MEADSLAWREREEKLETAEQMIWFQGDYVRELIEATDYPTFDIEAVNKTFMDWEHHKAQNIMGFRDNTYRSLMTGNMAAPHHTPWLAALDDSLEAYLNAGEKELAKA
jgi:trimethylamine monooxygenase